MAKLKGLKRVNRIINEFTSQFGLDAHIEPDFGYYRDDHSVAYSLVVCSADQYFIPYCNHIDNRVKADVFLVSLMHEIAHHFTQFNFSNEEWIKTDEIKEHISTQLTKYPEKAAKWNNVYFNLSVERAATEWALHYMVVHSDEIEAFWNELQPAIMRFYKKNGLI